jgi:hypothetical protein
MLVGAFDPSAWAGLVFCNGPGRGFAFRFAIECEGQRFDGYDLLDIADKIGPHAPDASYARMSFTNMSLEWSRANKTGCVGRVQMNMPGFLEFRPWLIASIQSHHDSRESCYGDRHFCESCQNTFGFHPVA